jgi:hypothetical protein
VSEGATATRPSHPTLAVWDLLARPFDSVAAASALLGLSRRTTDALAAAVLATSSETVELLTEMPRLLRSLSVATTSRPLRCLSEVRGPILWSETISARAASGGDPELMVCATPQRAYDTAENRVLVAALHQVVDAARSVERHLGGQGDQGRAARRLTGLALRYLDHRTLTGLPHRRPQRRDVARLRGGRRSRTYATALAVVDRAALGLSAEDIADVVDERTGARHALLVELVTQLRDRGHEVPALSVKMFGLVAGPVSYRHERFGRADRPTGVRLYDQPVEVDDYLSAVNAGELTPAEYVDVILDNAEL